MKRHFTLIEILIALSILALIMTTLFRFYVQMTSYKKKLEPAEKEILSRQLIQGRLSFVFSHIVPPSLLNKPSLYWEKDALYCIFDNGIDPEPYFSGPIRAKLYKKQDKLYLALSPLDTDKERLELLVTTHSFQCSFFEKKEGYRWKTTLSKEDHIPLFIRLKIGEASYAFFPPTEEATLSYP